LHFVASAGVWSAEMLALVWSWDESPSLTVLQVRAGELPTMFDQMPELGMNDD
jgi:hypothetical protein